MMAKNVGARHTGAKSRAQIRIAPIVRAFIPANVLDGLFGYERRRWEVAGCKKWIFRYSLRCCTSSRTP